jgi:hypothetical protein
LAPRGINARFILKRFKRFGGSEIRVLAIGLVRVFAPPKIVNKVLSGSFPQF